MVNWWVGDSRWRSRWPARQKAALSVVRDRIVGSFASIAGFIVGLVAFVRQKPVANE